MLLMVSLNSIVAERKMPSVTDSSFTLDCSSFTWQSDKIINYKMTGCRRIIQRAAQNGPHAICLKTNVVKWLSHLIPKELVKVSQFVGIGDLALQRRVCLKRSCGSADLRKFSLDPRFVGTRHLVRWWGESWQRYCRWETRHEKICVHMRRFVFTWETCGKNKNICTNTCN